MIILSQNTRPHSCAHSAARYPAASVTDPPYAPPPGRPPVEASRAKRSRLGQDQALEDLCACTAGRTPHRHDSCFDFLLHAHMRLTLLVREPIFHLQVHTGEEVADRL